MQLFPAILAENFELKVGLLTLVTSSQFHVFKKDDPHSHIRWFNKITSTLKYKNVPHEAIKLMLFSFSLKGATRIWLKKEPPRSIHTWEDLASKFVNYLFPPLKTTNLKNDIMNFQQRFDETFSEAWDRFKDLLRKCPHHDFLELHQIDTFYNALTQSDQDSLNAAVGGNLLNRTPRDALTIIENNLKVRTSRNKPVVSKVSATTSSSTPAYLPDITALTDAVKAMLLQNKTPSPSHIKPMEETCVICGGPHSYYECLATDGNTFNASAATRTYNQGGHGYRPQGETNYRASNQIRAPGFPQPNMQNNQNRVNVIPPDHVDDVPVVEPNQHDGVPVIPEPVLVDEDEDPKEEEFEEEEEPQEEEDDMEVDIEEDDNKPELTYPYEEMDPLNPQSPVSELEPKDVIEVEDTVESEDETVSANVHEVGNEVRSSVEEGTAAIEKLVKKLRNAEEKAECKKLKKELEEARSSNTLLQSCPSRPQICTFDSSCCSSNDQGKFPDAAIAAERARHVNAGNDARGSGPVRGQDVAPVVRECTFNGFMKCNPTIFREGKKVKFAAATLQGPALTWWNSKIATMGLETVKEYNIVAYTQRFNELALMCLRMVELKRVKVDAYIRGLSKNIKGEVNSSRPTNLNKAVRIAYKLMEQKSQARDERILEGKKRKWENFQSGNNSGKSNHKDNSRQSSQNNQKQGNA
ncbi:reverse transcriptase domain-containing protein [Tanacetum coccineum]|uniref:Reverse transcriptase domain-containing protein n=1 Tax=Tanacetum coccineum TaxID=301880 RepID=A0ABQ4Y4W4_9ASTR